MPPTRENGFLFLSSFSFVKISDSVNSWYFFQGKRQNLVIQTFFLQISPWFPKHRRQWAISWFGLHGWASIFTLRHQKPISVQDMGVVHSAGPVSRVKVIENGSSPKRDVLYPLPILASTILPGPYISFIQNLIPG